MVELTVHDGTKPPQPTGIFINNMWLKSSDGKTITSAVPRTVPYFFVSLHPSPLNGDESEIVFVYAASAVDVDVAVAAASKVFKPPSSRDMSPAVSGNMSRQIVSTDY